MRVRVGGDDEYRGGATEKETTNESHSCHRARLNHHRGPTGVRENCDGMMRNAAKNTQSPQLKSAVTCVIFDWAGTVLDFGSIAPVAAFRESFELHGLPVTEAEIRRPMGTAKRVHIEQILEQTDVQARWQSAMGRPSSDADVDKIYETFLRIDAEKSAVYSALIPGALEAVNGLRSSGILIGSTTGYPRSIMDLLAPLAEAQGYAPDCCVTVSEVERGRPAPDMLLANVSALGVTSVQSCVAVDDSPSGLEAARRSGMWAVGISVSGNEVGLSLADWQSLGDAEQDQARSNAMQKLADAGAHYVIDTVADLLPVIAQIDKRLQAGELP